MALTAGVRCGPYEIIAKIGAGGMGEVYRARDTKLDRDVALKILPDAFASDAERLARFELEAKTLAALRFNLLFPRGVAADFAQLAISPDGQQIVVAPGFGVQQPSPLWLRPLASTSGRLLTGTEGASFPFWSPDGRSIGFFADQKLKRLCSLGSAGRITGLRLSPGPGGKGPNSSYRQAMICGSAFGFSVGAYVRWYP